MKKRLIAYLILLCCCSVYYNFDYLWNTLNIELGNFYYSKSDYINAYSAYKKAFGTKQDNKIYVEKYYKTLSILRMVAPVQKELLDIKNDYPQNPYIQSIKEKFEQLKNTAVGTRSDNYINNIAYGDKILRWNTLSSPLKIYYQSKSSKQIPEYYYESIDKAFKTWGVVIGEPLQFERTNTEKDADFLIFFQDKIGDESCDASSCKIISGLTQHNISNKTLENVSIIFRTADSNDSLFSKLQIYNTAVHEIGHALGISGHSYNMNDVMYPISGDTFATEEIGVYLVQKRFLSNRDINTIKILYSLVPDITNKEYKNEQTVAMYYPEVILGDADKIAEDKLRESRAYLATVSDNAISWMNIADAYLQKQKYNEAEQAYLTALEYTKSPDQLHSISYNMSIMYYNLKEYGKSLLYTQKALSYQPSDYSSLEIAGYSYVALNDYKNAQNNFKTLTANEPDNINYSFGLIISYLKAYDFISAGRELSRIKAVNPASKDDDRIKKLSVISLVFK